VALDDMSVLKGVTHNSVEMLAGELADVATAGT